MPLLRKSFAGEVDSMKLGADAACLPPPGKKVAFNTKNTMSFQEFAQEVEKGRDTGRSLGIADWVLLPEDELCEEEFAMMRTMDAEDAEDIPLLEEEEEEAAEEEQKSVEDVKAEPEEETMEDFERRIYGAQDYEAAEMEEIDESIYEIMRREEDVGLFWSEEADAWERRLVNFKRAKQWNQIVHSDFQRSKKSTRKPRVRTRMLRRLNGFGGRPGSSAYVSRYDPSQYPSQYPVPTQQKKDTDLERAIAASLREAVNMTARESLRVAARPVETVLPCGLTAQQIHDLSTREMTPEDYELLLLLDEQVKPKTVSQAMIDAYDHSTVTAESLNDMTGDEDQCMVCLTEYSVGEELISLPCKHYFHAECITHWLTASSTKCPLDGLSLLED